jgi:DNA-binding NarL/FixJ family response regulator
VAAVRAHLGEPAFAAEWTTGRALTVDQAVALATAPAVSTLSPAPDPSRSAVPPPDPTGLTDRELEVVRLVAQGLTNDQVAEKLVISRRTVNRHLNAIYTKLGTSSRTALVRYAIEHGYTQIHDNTAGRKMGRPNG